MLRKLKAKFDYFLKLAEENVYSQPWLVVILMHEYYRNLYPSDPYISFDKKLSHIDRISFVLDKNIDILKSSSHLGSYLSLSSNRIKAIVQKMASDKKVKEAKTQKVYRNLWNKFDVAIYTKEAKKILVERFKKSRFDFSKLTNKIVLDLGCGNGRYTMALALITRARKVYGIDLGQSSIKKARDIAKKAKIRNVEFKLTDVLKIPFRDNFFDFVFCNGVLHHTKDMRKGIRELHRVLKPGSQAFLYLYADGGLFWYSRKKVPVIMKKIPQEYTMHVLDLIAMPANRFIFADNWYVPIERHILRKDLEDYLNKIGFCNIKKFLSGRLVDLDSIVSTNRRHARVIWGEGEHRYLLTKAMM